MKHYIKYLFPAALALCLTACTEETQPSDKEILEGRTSTKLEVSYSAAGSPVSALSFTHNAARKEIEVKVNNENLSWNLESNRDWCTVVPEEHKGSGTVTLEISANEEFEPSETATLTFVAGQFRGFTISANQSASAFILGQPYFLSKNAGQTQSAKITTITGTDWNFSAPDWINVATGASTSADGLTVTTLNITTAANDGKSRYGAIELSSGEEKDYIYVYQFGDDLDYDTNGNIYFPSGSPAVLSFTAPAYIVNSIQLPNFAKGEITENADGTSTVTITIDDNLSDCGEVRQVDATITLSNASATIVALPTLVQDYVPAYGLVTAKGLKAFAKAVEDGASTSDWEKDGVVTVIQDIDMTGVTDWKGIGSAAKPFTGSFDGAGHSVLNLKNTGFGLFNFTKDATIKGITLAKGSSLYNSTEFPAEGWFGGIVAHAENTAISDCAMNGDLEFGGTSENDDDVYVGAIVGYADAKSSVKSSRMGGKLTISTSSAPDLRSFAGGIAGLCEGSVSACEMTGQISFSSGIGSLYLGGIESSVIEGATVGNNSFMGAITLGGSASQVRLGGLYGNIEADHSFDNASDKSISLGTIDVASFGSGTDTRLFVGGFIGKAESDVTLAFKGYEVQTNFSLDFTVNRAASFVCMGGVLGGCETADGTENAAKEVSFESISNSGVISFAFKTSVQNSIARSYIGGVAGFVNGKASFKGCTNTGELGKLTGDANSSNLKHYAIVLGGIAGVVVGADADFTDCENKAAITNKSYSNSIPGNSKDGWYSACVASGILGAFDYKTTSVSGKLTMTGCTNGGAIVSYRGVSAGILGYARNATITSCSNYGDLGQNSTNSSNAANKGGIACALSQSTVKDCISKCNVFCSNPASAMQTPGGIVSLATGGGVTVTGCSYYGVLNVNQTAQPFNAGCIVGTAEADTVISNCKFGGKVVGSDVTENNLNKYVTGNELGEYNGLSYWNGNA